MERGRAARSLVGLALGFWTLSLVQAQAGPTWDRGDASFVETLGEGPEGQDKDRPVWPLRARLSGPTARYDHDILGGIPHWTRLTVAATACGSCPGGSAVQSFVLPETMVFEDVAPRLWDVTGDGRPEVVVVETALDRGARLAVWGFGEGDIFTRLATTAYIGAPHRWLAPIGAADLDGDGRIELVYVDRPHLAKELVVVRLEGGRLREVARAPGFSAHRIGDTGITGALRDCGDGRAEVLLPNGDWSRLLAVRLVSGRIVARDLGTLSKGALHRASAEGCE